MIFNNLGIGLSITMLNQLDIIVNIPFEFLDNTKGLLGVYNSNSTDDLQTPTGNTLSSNSSEKTIYFDFGEKCL